MDPDMLSFLHCMPAASLISAFRNCIDPQGHSLRWHRDRFHVRHLPPCSGEGLGSHAGIRNRVPEAHAVPLMQHHLAWGVARDDWRIGMLLSFLPCVGEMKTKKMRKAKFHAKRQVVATMVAVRDHVL